MPCGGGEELTPRKAREEFNSKAAKKSKAGKKSSDDNGDTGEDKKESAKKIVKQIGKGLKGFLK